MRSVRKFRPALETGQSVLEARNLLSGAVPLYSATTLTVSFAQGVFPGPPGSSKDNPKKLEGFEIEFSQGLDPASANNPANYTVLTNLKHGKKTTTTPVAFSVSYTTGVTGTFSIVDIRTSKQTFAHGGVLEMNGAPPSGIANLTDTLFLTGDTTLTISPNAKAVHPS
jgi:hypothetical protein